MFQILYPNPFFAIANGKMCANRCFTSHGNLSSKREFLTGWFYDEPFERIDAKTRIVFSLGSFWYIGGTFNKLQRHELLHSDLPKLEKEVNKGKPLPYRSKGEKPLECIRFNLEPIRYRHKPLFCYTITHSSYFLLRKKLDSLEFKYITYPQKTIQKNLDTFINREEKQSHLQEFLLYLCMVWGACVFTIIF